MRRSVITTLYLSILIASASCTGNKVYDHYEHTPIIGWNKADTLFFTVQPLNVGGRYVTELGLRINESYPFQNLTLIVEQTVIKKNIGDNKIPNSKLKDQKYIDTLTCTLFDNKGAVKGQGISYYQYHFRVSELNLHQEDSIHITVRHDMKREIMPGIADVGISISR